MGTTGKRATKTATGKVAARKTAARKPAASTPAAGKPSAGKPAAHGSDPSHYTQPELRDQLKDQILAGDKGGHAGQWSARKAQLLAHEYEAAGGGYRGGKSPAQRHLDEWTHEAWTTADGKPAQRGDTTARYLPEKAWEELTPAEQRATDKKKRAASKSGRQFVANTERAAAKAAPPKAAPPKAAPPKAAPPKPAAKRAPAKAVRGTAAAGAAARRTTAKRPRR